MTLVSLHLPKTAGTSFARTLAQAYGEHRFVRDYASRPFAHGAFVRKLQAMHASLRLDPRLGRGDTCVHGHFLPVKYFAPAGMGLYRRPGFRYITWLRDPIERLASHYHYWRRNPDPQNPWCRRVNDEDWTLERFALSRHFRNFYSQYLWRCPLDRFDFVGIVEDYDAELRRLQGLLPALGCLTRNDANRAQGDGTRWIQDASLRRRLEDVHAHDMRLYRQALAMRSSVPDRSA